MHGSRCDGLVEPVRAEIRRMGGAIDRERLGRHVVIYWSIAGRKCMTVVPLTSSDWHALENARSHVRRLARSEP
jgi:hypothetical protein